MPKELWTEFHDMVQEIGIKTIPMEKNSDLFKKFRDTKGTFHTKMGTTKDRSSLDLTEAENIKRWQEYIEVYKKIFMTQITTML